jgi:hypothetical protein
MNLWLGPLRELRQMGISVVVAHHVNKGAGSLRGSSVLGGEADTLIEMRPTHSKDNPGVVEYVTVVNQKQKDFVPFVPFRMHLESVELEPTPGGRERSGPVLVYSQDAYEGKQASDGRRLNASARRAQMRETMVEIITDEPGLSWRRLREEVPGKNTEKQVVRDELVETGILEYDESLGGYILGWQTLDVLPEAEIPPLLGESEEE